MNLNFQFGSLSEFLNMGDYAFYVWLAYGVSFAVYGILVVSCLSQRKRVIKQISQKQAREARLKQHRSKAA
ncbi:heme exporter protein D [Ferrimonas sediminum]|uniref:Heme exporter protein D n=1 Tax=Ferrimonas sediminum TaxID=718193 RepID=A0A1G9B8Y5_9GAMM|nr:heme exporter protein CcmD [Ferrimonas sediminum]SDK35480.1 heme exporter protein D [Ferrimonas sediminum]